MKKISIMLFLFLFLFTITLSAGCAKKSTSVDTVKYLKNLGTYTCNVKISIINSKGTIEYCGKEFYNSKYGSLLKLQEGRNYLYKGSNITVLDKELGIAYSMDESQDLTFRLSFLNYFFTYLYSSDNNAVKEKTVDQKELYVTVEIPEHNDNLSKGTLYIDSSKKVPIKLIIFDKDGQQRVIYTFTSFTPSVSVNKDIFNTKLN